MEAAYRKEADCMIVPMPQEVDHHVANGMSREIDLLAESWHVHKIIFDFAETDFMDSSGIGVLIGRKKDGHACWKSDSSKSWGACISNIRKIRVISDYFIGKGGTIRWRRKITCRCILMQNP